jgi:FkbM family methyltransferase
MKLSLSNGRFNPVYTYYGQMGEDKHIHTKYFPSLRNGVFVEMGALNGVKYSNTKFFEDTRNWSGVLIEPNPTAFAELRINRPRSTCYQCAVSKTVGEIEFYANDAVGSVKKNTTEEFFNGWHKNHNIQIIKVPSMRLDKLLHQAGARFIDFWSLDVEGSEYEALETMDWSIPVYIILIETQTPERKKQCDDILLTNGFIFEETVAHNELWINPNNKRSS